jgi:hypothetical protein
VLQIGNDLIEYCQIHTMLWVRAHLPKDIFGTITIIPFLFVIDTLRCYFDSSSYQGYLNLAEQDHCLFNLWYLTEVKINVRISLSHLNASERVRNGNYSDHFYC